MCAKYHLIDASCFWLCMHEATSFPYLVWARFLHSPFRNSHLACTTTLFWLNCAYLFALTASRGEIKHDMKNKQQSDASYNKQYCIHMGTAQKKRNHARIAHTEPEQYHIMHAQYGTVCILAPTERAFLFDLADMYFWRAGKNKSA